MKKFLIGFAIFMGVLILLWAVGRITGALEFYRAPSEVMEPTIKKGSRFAVSNLKKPKRYDIIAYNRVITEKDGFDTPGRKLVFSHRLVGFGGETIEIRNGYAYIDGRLVDDSTKLKFDYLINSGDFIKVAGVLDINIENPLPPNFFYMPESNRAVLNLTYNEYQKVNQVAPIILDTTVNTGNDYSILYGNDESKKWTVNNYGPFHIPEDCYFVLGDSRNRVSDSRYVGPIPKKDWKGTALKK